MYRRMLAVIGLITALSASAMARQPDWQLLGERTVEVQGDRDVIRVGQTEEWFRNRSFKALHFAVARNDVHFNSIRLVYLNGHAETIEIDRLVRAGEELPVDLRGDRSYIREIEMRYRARANFRGQAVVQVYGEPARRAAPPVARADLVLLGQQSVGFLVDRDVINIGQTADWYANRAFKALHFQVERNDVHFDTIELVYLNGYAETINVDRLVRAGEEVPIDLRGERSYIKQIGMRYRSRPNFRGQAVVRVMAEPARRGSVPPPPAPPPSAGPDWEVLGEQTVGFEVDRDVIRVGRREGRFSRIRLEVRNNDVFVNNIRVRFGNGEEQSFDLREEIRAGSRSRPLDLSGDRRFIERIELTYRARPGFRGQATVTVLGYQGPGRPESAGPPPRRDRAIVHSAETLRFFRSYGGRKVVEQGVRSVEFRVPELGVGQQTMILIAHGRPVRVRSLDIRFHSTKDGGKPQIADLNMRLDPSEGTPLIDIPGSARFPVRVTVEVEPLGRGEAQLELMLSGNKIERIMRDQR